MSSDRSIRILLHSNSASVGRIIRKLLNEIGFHNIDEAENSQMALEKLTASSYGFVISDWETPRMASIGLLQAIRAKPEMCELPFMMFTAESMPQNIPPAMSSGASGFFTWPWTASLLDKKISDIFEKKRGSAVAMSPTRRQ